MTGNIKFPPLPLFVEGASEHLKNDFRNYARAAILADRASQAPAPVEAIAAAEALEAARASIRAEFGLHFPLRKPELSAEQQGLFQKFIVRRTDGRDEPGCKHENCEYFVLDVSHDPHAKAALAAYADAVEATHGPLAADLRSRYGLLSTAPVEVSRLAQEAKHFADECRTSMTGSGKDYAWGRMYSAIDRLATMASTPASEVPAGWVPLSYATPLELFKAFKGGTKFTLHYHGKTYPVKTMEPREKVVYVSPPGFPVKVFPDGKSCEGDNGTIWLAATPASPATEGDAVDQDCPHAAPFRYCPQCVVNPCPIGLGDKQ